jgi:addiction module HigA family antidote
MLEKFRNEYEPDTVSVPGETLAEVLDDRAMSQAELADRMGRPKKTINEIINGKSEITPDTSVQLERVLGIPASFWTALERNYRVHLARASEAASLQDHLDWYQQFPLAEMIKLGWIERADSGIDQVRMLLSFFSVSSKTQWGQRYRTEAVAFRLPQTFKPDVYALTGWLREGERQGHSLACASFDSTRFREALRTLRTLTTETEPSVFVPKLQESCARSGVAVVFVPELKGSRACGATRWLGPQKALIQLSLRYKSNDHLWFTFFHEAGHVVLHGKRGAFVELHRGSSGTTEDEEEANRFAGDCLIPRAEYGRFVEDGQFSAAAVRSFAKRVGVASGVVAGRLQHDGFINYNQLNTLKVYYRWPHESE